MLDDGLHVLVAQGARVDPRAYGATRGKQWRRVTRGVVVSTSSPIGVAERAFALALALPRDSWFSHVTAAHILGLPLPRALEAAQALHVSVPGGRPAPRRAGVVAHRRTWPVRPWEAQLVTGRTREPLPLRLERPAPCLVSCASILELPDLVALGDAMLRQHGTPFRAELEMLLSASARRAGAAAVRRALPLLRPGVRSRAESLLRLQVHEAGLPEPVVEHPVRVEGGVLHPDLAWPDFRTIVEYEGDVHRIDRRTYVADIRRFERYDDAGWSSLRLTRDDVFERPDRAMERIEARLRRQGWRPPSAWRRRPTLKVAA